MTIRIQTNHGNIDLELNEALAPATCANFLAYVEAAHYDNTLFHRVIPGFMVQGGGFDPQMQQKSTQAQIQNEADNGLTNDTGTIAMARTNDPHSATSQFFINVNDNTFLNHTAKSAQGWGYCVFGKVSDGMDVIMAISMLTTGNVGGHGDVPVEAVVIESIKTIDD